jgi:transposase
LAHTHDAALFRRILALLQVDLGEPISEVARLLHVNRRSVYRWMQRFTASHQIESLERQPGQGRPLEWNEDLAGLLESAMKQPPVELGYPANGWTAPLLEAFLSIHFPDLAISAHTVRRRLKDLGYVWKHGRYVLPPDPEEEKKTLDFAPNTRFACGEPNFGRR